MFGGDTEFALKGRVDNTVTDAINFYYSLMFRREAEKSMGSHQFEDKEFGFRMEFKNAPLDMSVIYRADILTYGF